ncbi:hypothetical protein [Achromobacter ruhlandii]|uniref:hypothetical protein n=1 Tax=Achromobacter ruhlandii TaxID=72557 RepID=UPI000C26AFC8|nr:hypothetical protein [Achromobacter ruhlandii]PJM89035.1 hypothetical protein CV044_11940 [Achromobacter ruhlandii]
MALIECPECKSAVSDQALKCPSCAYQLRKAKRGLFGKLFKLAFILFNVLMAVWLIGGVGAAGEHISTAASEAERAGAAIGTSIGAFMILTLWVIGDIILGALVFFTRPKN